MSAGYYRYPTIHGETIVFTCEDDLWAVDAEGGTPRRLTAGLAEATHAQFSPDGRHIAFTGREEGSPDLYVMPASGGTAKRLTFEGVASACVGWTPDGSAVVYASTARQPFTRQMALFRVPLEGGEPTPFPWGPARHLAYGPNGGIVLGRNTGFDPARWKRYKGGTAGELWIDRAGDGRFEKLIDKVGNPTSPMWVGGRIYFLADHEGVGNLYSCLPAGTDVRRETDHSVYYARQATTDGRRIVYHAGADLCLHDPAEGTTTTVAIAWPGPAPQANRKFVRPERYLDGLALHPKGRSLALTTRGKAFAAAPFAGPVVQLGAPQGERHRAPSWLPDGQRVVAVTDGPGEETLILLSAETGETLKTYPGLAIGRVVELACAPHGEQVAIANHRHELLLVDLASGALRVLDQSPAGGLAGFAWSPDGRHLAYGFPLHPKQTAIKLVEVASGATHQVTEPVLHDVAPSWDPKGDYLYYLSYRVFDPVYDNLHFDLGFPKGVVPCALALRKDVRSPFVARPEADEKPEAASEGAKDEKKAEADKNAPPMPVGIDLDGIARRVVAFPVPEARYVQVAGIEGKVLFVSVPPEGARGAEHDTAPKGLLEVYDFASQKRETLVSGMSALVLSADAKTMLVRAGDKLRLTGAGEKPKADAPDAPGRESGLFDWNRVRVSIEPRAEWRQMYREAWRLQRDQFWTEDMSSVDWARVHEVYSPLVDRVATRSEFSDLLWEMQGELGTSHAYEYGGDYRPSPRYARGFLGATFRYDEAAAGYRIASIVDGDPGTPGEDSPLNAPGLDVRAGDVVTALNGLRLTAAFGPQAALVNQADVEVQLTLAPREANGAARTVTVKTLAEETSLAYRAWVEANRRAVHGASGGRVGYVHIPDMMAHGYAEFHRGYLVEARRDALVVDVRHNGGGHVSQLILEKLARQRLGYDIERWGAIKPYPDDSVGGPLVGLTDEAAGSDGDIFSHCFKLMKLGPLLGKRTWGGVIGIWPRHALVDGSTTTQPEFSFWFKDVGWGVENYGTEPDVEVDNTPQAYAAGEDTQLKTAIATALELLAKNPPVKPDFSKRPNLSAPKLPPRWS